MAGLLGVSLDEIVRRAERARKRRNRLWAALAGVFLFLAVAATGSAIYAYQKFLESEDRLDQAIEIAYGFVAEATGMSDRYGVPTDIILSLLTRAEDALNGLISRGANSETLRFRKSLMLLSFSKSYDSLGQTDIALQRAIEARDGLLSLVGLHPKKSDLDFATLQAQVQIGEQLFVERQLRAALQSLRAGLVTGEELLKQEPGRLDVSSYLVATHIDIGNVLFVLGAFTNADDSYRAANDEIIKLGGGGANEDLVSVLNKRPDLMQISTGVVDRLAELNLISGALDTKSALKYHEGILAFRENLAQSDPQSLHLQYAVLDSQLHVSNLLLDTGSFAEATQSFQAGLERSEKLSASDAKNVAFQKLVAIFRDGVGRSFLARGLTSEALAALQSNLDDAKKFIDTDSGNLTWQGLLGIGYEHIGDALMLQPDISGALKEYRAENAIISKLAEKNPDDADWQARLAISNFKIGDALLALGLPLEAEPSIQASLTIRARQASANPGAVLYKAHLLQAQWRVAQIHGDSGSLGKAQLGLAELSAAKRLGDEEQRWFSRSQAELNKSGQDGPTVFLPGCEGADFDRAISDCTQIINVGGEDTAILVIAYKKRADAYGRKNQLQQSIADYSEAVRLAPTNSDLYNSRGVAYFRKSDLDLAFADFTVSIRLDPTNAVVHSNLGRVYERRGQFDDAIAEHDIALRLNSKLAIAFANCGLAFEGKGDRDKALMDFNAALVINPELQRAIEGRDRIQAGHIEVR